MLFIEKKLPRAMSKEIKLNTRVCASCQEITRRDTARSVCSNRDYFAYFTNIFHFLLLLLFNSIHAYTRGLMSLFLTSEPETLWWGQ